MDNKDLIAQYNYDSFIPESFEPWMRFDDAPHAGTEGPDFTLWTLDEDETSFSSVLSENLFTIVEFGSFT